MDSMGIMPKESGFRTKEKALAKSFFRNENHFNK